MIFDKWSIVLYSIYYWYKKKKSQKEYLLQLFEIYEKKKK